MYKFTQYLRHGIPASYEGIMENLLVTNDFVRVEVSSSGNRQVDFGEVCILDPQVSKKILQVHVDK